MKPGFALLKAPALVIPTTRGWSGQLLGAGSIVRVRIDASEKHPLDIPRETLVDWVDITGRESSGWLAVTAQLSTPPARARLLNRRDELSISPVDRLRDLVSQAQARSGERWSMERWCCIFGGSHIEELYDAARELGGKIPSTASVETAISRTLRLVLCREVNVSAVKGDAESTSATSTATTKSSKSKSAPKKAAPAAKKTARESAPARSMARTCGATVLPLLEKGGGSKASIAIAKKLASDAEVGKKDLVTLRDEVNVVADKARNAGKDSLASQLSSANRLVRRLARK